MDKYTKEERKLRSEIFQAIGHASTCWSDLNKAGIFDSCKSAEIGENLYNQIIEDRLKIQFGELE